MKRYNRGEIAPVEWLDHLTLQQIQQYRGQVLSIEQCFRSKTSFSFKEALDYKREQHHSN